MILRYSTINLDDYNLCKTHDVDYVEPIATCPWPGSDQLLEEALFLVPENMPAGKVNGKRLEKKRCALTYVHVIRSARSLFIAWSRDGW